MQKYWLIFYEKKVKFLKKRLAKIYAMLYNIQCCDIERRNGGCRAKHGFSAERCPVHETGRQGHCTEYWEKAKALCVLTLRDTPG